MNEKVKIKEFMQVLKRRFLIIILTTICTSGFIIISSMYLMKPIYQYSTQVLAGSLGVEKEENPVNRVQDNKQLALSYMDIIKSPYIMIGVKEELKLARSSYDLLQQVSVTNRNDSQIITISVKDSNPQLAKKIAQSVAKQSISKFKDYANVNRLNILNDSGVTEEAELLFPKPKFIIAISIIISFFAGIGLAILREHFDDSTYNNRELEYLGLPLLGRVNLNTKKRNNKQKTAYKSLSSMKQGEHNDHQI
ncbi:YveK family protein [Bacillus pseudomycoides]|uniref:YveK family protein n=1 Tax=Bacillus pseudomycoides TaxID=64104 RepID=UPI000BECA59D|nr:Wzz/FepE/Etk N-terminal domain-containing protein [Bacillus pseudomycoides]MED4651722.1 Wzz/FepE/Etk N-terminal domain-containing protein [Bacillus pseudomycoides]PEE03267.1 capsule biosynthesis protein CapK [Bacillus pseudomycoides]PEM66186.1 capsule biosynthesis protein CapK [Bacillus pseudomycoides]PHC86177.1 capsule biosynthesis protein CapK [Bacillus pseudomycoides]